MSSKCKNIPVKAVTSKAKVTEGETGAKLFVQCGTTELEEEEEAYITGTRMIAICILRVLFANKPSATNNKSIRIRNSL